MDKLETIERTVYNLYIIVAVFWLGIYIALLVAKQTEKEHIGPVVLVHDSCRECTEKKDRTEEKEVKHHG